MRLRVIFIAAVLLLVGCGSADTSPTTASPAETEAVDAAVAADEGGANAAEPVDEPADAAESAAEVEPVETAIDEDRFPTVVGARATWSDGATWNVSVTLSSPYDTPERYADAWRILDSDDNEIGIRVLGHDHANEQPFTRSASIEIPADLTTVFVEGRDQAYGWSGERFALTLEQ